MQLAVLNRPEKIKSLTVNLLHGEEQQPVDLSKKLLLFTKDDPGFSPDTDFTAFLNKALWSRAEENLGRTLHCFPAYFLLVSAQDGSNCWDFNYSLFRVVSQTEKLGTLYLADFIYEGGIRFSVQNGHLKPQLFSNGDTPKPDTDNKWRRQLFLICHAKVFLPSFHEFLGQPLLVPDAIQKAIFARME